MSAADLKAGGLGAALEALARSPLAAEAAARAEAARAEARRSILEAMARDEAAARGDERRAAAAVVTARGEVAQLRDALAAARARLGDAERDELNAAARADAARNRAGAALADLGNAAIDDAIGRLAIAERQSSAAIAYRDRRDPYGRLLACDETDPAPRQRAARLRAWREDLERMRFDATVTPAAVETRCRAAIAELDARQPEAPTKDAVRIVPPRLA